MFKMEENEMGLPPLIYDVPSSFNLSLARNLYGIVAPIIVILTILNNIMVVITVYSDLPKKGSASRIQHAAIACCNSLFGVVQLPVYFYFFAGPNFPTDVPKAWCGAFRILGFVFPHIIHTTSMWQFVGLSIQRFLVFRFPFSCVAWYNIRNMTKLVKIITCICVLLNIYKFCDFEIIDFEESVVLNGTAYSVDNILPCRAEYRFTYGREGYGLFCYWFIALSVHIFPCFILSIVYMLLVYAICRNNKRRQNLSRNSRNGRRLGRNQTLKECSVLVMMTLCLVVEIPSAVIRVKRFIFTKDDVTSGDDEIIFTHFFLLLSYYFYVYIYIVMNSDFRKSFLSFLRKCQPAQLRNAIELRVMTANV